MRNVRKLRVNHGPARVKSQKELSHSRFVVSFDARERSLPEPLWQGFCWLRLFSQVSRGQASKRPEDLVGEIGEREEVVKSAE